MAAEILTLPSERDATTGEYRRSKYLWLVLQPVSPLAMPAEILALFGERDTTPAKYWRSKYQCLALQPVSPKITSRNISFGWGKRCHNWCILEVKIPMPGTTVSES